MKFTLIDQQNKKSLFFVQEVDGTELYMAVSVGKTPTELFNNLDFYYLIRRGYRCSKLIEPSFEQLGLIKTTYVMYNYVADNIDELRKHIINHYAEELI